MRHHATTRARFGIRALVVALLSSLVALGGALAYQYLETRGTAAYQCLMAVPPGVAQTEQALVHSRVSAWPIGRACTWLMADGNLTTVQSGWTVTAVATAATAICVIVAGIFAFRANHRRHQRRWWWFTLALVGPAITWLILAARASTFVYSAALG